MATQIHVFPFNIFSENTYLLIDTITKETVVIDPGFSNEKERTVFTNYVKDNNLIIKYLLNTHCHADHVLGNNFVENTYNVELQAHKQEIPILEAVVLYAGSYRLGNIEPMRIKKFITEGDTITFGSNTLHLLHTPGHSPGSICFYNPIEKYIIAGDVLFYENIGRTDFPMCSHSDLMDSITKKLYALENEYVVYPGHGRSTTIQHEKNNNPHTHYLFQ